MSGMYMLIPTLLVIFFSFLIVRAAAIAFMMTGMDQKRARFQALSAFSGTGQSLLESNTPENEFWIVGIARGKNWISLPRSAETINEGDKLVVYGQLKTLRQLFREE